MLIAKCNKLFILILCAFKYHKTWIFLWLSKPQGSNQQTHSKLYQGSKGTENSQLSSVLATIPQEPGEVAEVVHQGKIYKA